LSVFMYDVIYDIALRRVAVEWKEGTSCRLEEWTKFLPKKERGKNIVPLASGSYVPAITSSLKYILNILPIVFWHLTNLAEIIM
jgi:hypothetical protein